MSLHIYTLSTHYIYNLHSPAGGGQVDCVEDHTDYVQCLCVEAGWVATGGQGDKKIHVYRHSRWISTYLARYIYNIYNYIYSTGRLSRRHTCCGHTGWVRRLAIRGDTLVSGSLDMTLRVSRYLQYLQYLQ